LRILNNVNLVLIIIIFLNNNIIFIPLGAGESQANELKLRLASLNCASQA
jgi:hypothetical protein